MLKSLLLLHIISGSLALVSGFIAIATIKGSRLHKRSGKLYFYAMLGVALTAVIISLAKGNDFLLSIGIFSFYLTFSGYRSIYYSRQNGAYRMTDKIAAVLATLTGLYMLGKGVLPMFNGTFSGNIPLAVFGGILLWRSVSDLRRFGTTSEDPKAHILRHIGNMGGSYISASTAFLVVNVHFEPTFVPWLLPTLIGTPLIAMAIRKRRKWNLGNSVA